MKAVGIQRRHNSVYKKEASFLVFHVLFKLLVLQKEEEFVSMAFKVGHEVEVFGVDEGYKNAFYAGQITALKGTEVEVAYDNKKTLSGEPLVETVVQSQVRRIPEAVIADFEPGDSVEVWLSGGWWRGIVVAADDFFARVYFAYRPPGHQHSVYPNAQLRVHQKWHNSGEYIFWQYRKKNTAVAFQTGDQVEVLGVDGISRFAVFGAKVLNVEEEMVEIEYKTKRNPAGGRLTEKVHLSQVRYVPDVIVCDFQETEFVEVWIDGAWWGGIVVGGDNESAIVFFGYKPVGSQYVFVRKTRMRLHQLWKRRGMFSMWVYRKKVV